MTWADIVSPVHIDAAGVEYCSPFPSIVYLSGASNPASRAAAHGGAAIGLLATPDNGYLLQIGHYRVWAADNGCYGAYMRGTPFNHHRWQRWVAQIPHEHRPRCLFVTVPDVVFDARATLEEFHQHVCTVTEQKLPPALVAQDGLEDLDIPWDKFSALFLGGSTAWKVSQAAADLAAEARRRGKWVHAGRVNSKKRLLHFASGAGGAADSADGTYLGFGPRLNTPKLQHWLEVAAAADWPDGQEHRFRERRGYGCIDDQPGLPSVINMQIPPQSPPPPDPESLASWGMSLVSAVRGARSIASRRGNLTPVDAAS